MILPVCAGSIRVEGVVSEWRFGLVGLLLAALLQCLAQERIDCDVAAPGFVLDVASFLIVHDLPYDNGSRTSGFARGSVDLPGRAVSEGMKNLGKLLGSTGVVTSMGIAQTPVNFTIKGWEHVVLQSGADTIEIEYETDSRSSRITSLRHNGEEIDAAAWDDRIWACEGRTVEYTACAPEGFPAWTEHLEEGPSGLCNLACAARERAIQSLVEAAGGEYDEENAGYGYELDNEGNLVSTDEAA